MTHQERRRWPVLLMAATVLLAPVGLISAQASSPTRDISTGDARMHVAGPDMLFLDGVVIGGEQYAIYLSADDDGRWLVTSVEPIDRRALPKDVILDMAELSTRGTGELRIENIYLDGRFYSGTVAFNRSYRQVEAYEFSSTPQPAPSQSALLRQLADMYDAPASSGEASGNRSGETSVASSGETTSPQDPVIQRLDEYAARGAERLDRLETRIDELAHRLDAAMADGGAAVTRLINRVDAAVTDGGAAVTELMSRVTAASSGSGGSAPAVDDIAPTLSLSRARAEMATTDILDLSAGIPVSGSWRAADTDNVSQIDPDARFAKLILPYRQDSRPRLYRVVTRAPGEGWAGVGLHLSVSDVELPAGYGYGRSILVWLTRDVQAYGQETTFLEVYISYDDFTMNRVAQSALDSDLSVTSALEVLMDPGAGILTVAIDGVEQFRYRLNLPQGAGLEVALRALGEGEFSDLEVRRR
ncbi:MAG: hypothetical protein WD492_13400 [Alkalispirochaeta sp.]